MKIAVYLQSVAYFLTVLLLGLTGCQKQNPESSSKTDSLHSHTNNKESKIAVPPAVAGKWKAVKIAVIDKGNLTQKVYTIPIGGQLAIPASEMVIKAETFLPDFLIEGTTMTSSSDELKNPGVRVQIIENGAVLFKGWLFSKFPNTHSFMHPKYGFTLVGEVAVDK